MSSGGGVAKEGLGEPPAGRVATTTAAVEDGSPPQTSLKTSPSSTAAVEVPVAEGSYVSAKAVTPVRRSRTQTHTEAPIVGSRGGNDGLEGGDHQRQDVDADASDNSQGPTQTTLFLIRHGESLANAMRVIQGHMDVELSDHGVEQAVALGHHLAATGIDFCPRIYASDLRRAADTAAAVVEVFSYVDNGVDALEVTLDDRLRELNVGEWQGMGVDDVTNRADYKALRESGDVSAKRGGEDGESFVDLLARASEAVRDVVHRHPGENVLMFCHGGTIRVVSTMLLGMPLANMHRLVVSNCSVSTFHVEAEAGGDLVGTLSCWNDTAYLG